MTNTKVPSDNPRGAGRWPNRKAVQQTGRRAPVLCPVCRREQGGPQGLHAHMRTAHAAHYAQHGVEAAPAAPKEEMEDAGELIVAAPPPAPRTAVSLLDAAIQQLEERAGTIAAELAQLTALEKEAAGIGSQIAALHQAKKAFLPAVPAEAEPENPA